MSTDKFWEIVRERLPDAVRLRDHPAAWDEACDNLDLHSVGYLRSMVEYQNAYVRSANEYHDLSLVLFHGGEPVGVWPLGMARPTRDWRCGSYGAPLLAPRLSKTLSEKVTKKLIGACQDAVDALCRHVQAESWKGVQTIFSQGADTWHRRIMERGATVVVTHELYVDLGLTAEELKASVRKSYKSLIAEGRKLWQATLLDRVSADVFSEFRELHQHVAGRVTRARETWDLQEQAINRGDAFLVVLRDGAQHMVGAGLFYCTRDEGLYAVAAYDRELFDAPLGHVVQATAIEYMKQRGLRWYKIGDRPYPGDVPAPTEKELAIGYFKEGFCTNIFLKVHTTCPVAARAPVSEPTE